MTEELLIISIMAFIILIMILCIVLLLAVNVEKNRKQIETFSTVISNIRFMLDKVHLDLMRTNIMFLIHDYPDNPTIQELARSYVEDYNGNSYVIPIILDWYNKRHLEIPEWLSKAAILHGELK